MGGAAGAARSGDSRHRRRAAEPFSLAPDRVDALGGCLFRAQSCQGDGSRRSAAEAGRRARCSTNRSATPHSGLARREAASGAGNTSGGLRVGGRRASPCSGLRRAAQPERGAAPRRAPPPTHPRHSSHRRRRNAPGGEASRGARARGGATPPRGRLPRSPGAGTEPKVKFYVETIGSKNDDLAGKAQRLIDDLFAQCGIH